MWLGFAVGSAFFAGITAVLAKIGVRTINSTLATAIRTIVVVFFSWLMVLFVGSQRQISQITSKTLCFLVLSGLSTGASWLCYFKALQLGDVNKVAPIDKSSTVLTILLAFLSAVFASLTSIFGKIGVENVESNLETAIRTIVVLAMAWLMVFMTGEQKEIQTIDRKSWLFLVLSGITTGLSWLCYYRALQDGPASVLVPIDKLSILVTILFSSLILKERLSKKAALGLVLLLAGTGAMLL